MQKWLFNLSERIEALEAILETPEGECVQQDIKDALRAIYDGDIPAAISDGIEWLKKEKAELEKIDVRIAELKSLKESRRNRMERARRGYAEFLEAVGKKKVETTYGNMTLCEPTISTEIDDAAIIPADFKRTTVRIDPDKIKIKEALLAGASVPGAHLEEKRTVRIK